MASSGPRPDPPPAADLDQAPSEVGSQPQRGAGDSATRLTRRQRRRARFEQLVVRLIATLGVVGIGVAIGAIMISNGSEGWLTGLVVSAVSVILAAGLWSSRRL